MYHYRTLAVLLIAAFAAVAVADLLDPGLPVENPSIPGWFYGYNDVYNPMYQTLRTTKKLPSTADVTIIGGGWTGVSVAYWLSLLAPQLNVVLLEARGIAEGATGRNVGFMSPKNHKGFVSSVASLGLAAVKKEIEFENSVAEDIKTLIELFNWDDVVELDDAGQVFIYRIAAEWNSSKADLAAYRAAGYTDVVEISTAECNALFGINNALGCIKSNKAYKMRPPQVVWKLLEHTMKLNKFNLNVQTETPVTSVTKIAGAASPLFGETIPYLLQLLRPAQYLVSTPRGNIRTNTVVYATNAWTPHLLKNLQYGGSNAQFIFPVVQYVIQTNVKKPVQIHEAVEFSVDQYAVQHRASGGWVVGQGWYPFISSEAPNATAIEQSTHADSINFAKTYFPKKSDLSIAHEWTGILAYTQTGFPYVGPIGGKGRGKLFSNQWGSFGMNGHGQPRAFGAARALVKEMLYGIVESGLPEHYQSQLLENF